MATVFACCALWQFRRPGKSHQERYGYPEWGDKPCGDDMGDDDFNTVVMWRSNDKGQAEKEDQVPICLTSRPQHIPFTFHSLLTHITIRGANPVQLDVADSQKIGNEEVVAEYKPNDNAIELLKVPIPLSDP